MGRLMLNDGYHRSRAAAGTVKEKERGGGEEGE